MTDAHDAAFYIQVRPEFLRAFNGGQRLKAIKAVAMTQHRPARPQPGTVLVKLTLRIPDAAFMPLRPEAIVIVPENLTEAGAIEVEASDPHRPPDDEGGSDE